MELVTKVRTYGAEAISYLLPLLEHDDAAVRELAAYTMIDIEGLSSEHFGALREAAENEVGWIYRVLARLGTPQAIDYLVEKFRKRPSSGSALAEALRMLGAKGAISIAELLACLEQCDERLPRAVSSVFRGLNEDGSSAIPRLMEIATDERFHISSRREAISSIGEIGESSGGVVPQLIALKESTPPFAHTIDRALIDIGVEEALPGIIHRLPSDSYYALRDLITLGDKGYDAGPIVLNYLDDPDWDVRVIAAEALGHIGYLPAVPNLVDILSGGHDWKLDYAAILSLARLEQEQLLDELERVHNSHWYSPVREVARVSIQHIRTGAAIDLSHWWRFGRAENSPETCTGVAYETIEELEGTKLYSSRDEDRKQLEILSYDIEVVGVGAAEGTEPNDNGIIEITPENMVEYVEIIEQVPNIGLKVPNGWLVGASRGEWGGEIVHVASNGDRLFLVNENVEDIFPLGDKIIATAGLAHLSSNRGMLLEIKESEDGVYSASPWRRLPGEPVSSWLIEGNKLLVNTRGAGSVVVDADGTLSMAECTIVNEDS
ncbi:MULTISPECIES: HEAT repeat domain-containing protein [Gammaproteobacteria]|uniref:HEAT repeat domain-containing protein n=1 Tax=Gammaproteobacteria TaxID=1236 RepID=UPI000F7FFD59|nr:MULTISPECIES: HEAT repeat domain-containing protein [Gammaproteobacteria]RTE85492.1 HEAT repeat domain-containing protein [Aliidiomarina sp. B3213]TCZ89460.1 HEAT repeat domain-containing protein [Lysobacter sp. N42]